MEIHFGVTALLQDLYRINGYPLLFTSIESQSMRQKIMSKVLGTAVPQYKTAANHALHGVIMPASRFHSLKWGRMGKQSLPLELLGRQMILPYVP
jgi:hypothetical protein